MRDLKDLLEPLGERDMPDRWDDIGRRPIAPIPEPRRSRSGAFVVAAAVALVTVAVIARLSPLGDGGGPATSRRSGTETPAGDARAVLPTSGSVADGRFVEPVELDDGILRVDPLPSDTPIPDGVSRTEDLLWASASFSGKQTGVVGYGLITLEGGYGHAGIERAPGWIAFGWGGISSCPMMTAAPDPPDLPSNGYVAVAIMPTDGYADFSYEARSSACGEPAHGPSVGSATHVESIEWTQDASATSRGVRITYTPAPCGSHATFDGSGSPSGTSLMVSMSVPDAALPCPSPVAVTQTLTGPGWGDGRLSHAKTGLVRQATFAS